jgi:ribokinase
VDVLILNETELAFLSGANVGAESDNAAIGKAGGALRAFPAQVICVTLGARGVLALIGETPIALKGHAVAVKDTTGAGDCFVGAVAARLAAGAPIDDALRYANSAAAISVQRIGAGPSMPTSREVQESIAAP